MKRGTGRNVPTERHENANLINLRFSAEYYVKIIAINVKQNVANNQTAIIKRFN